MCIRFLAALTCLLTLAAGRVLAQGQTFIGTLTTDPLCLGVPVKPKAVPGNTIIGTLAPGDTVTIEGYANRHYYIRQGYISGYVEEELVHAPAGAIAKRADWAKEAKAQQAKQLAEKRKATEKAKTNRATALRQSQENAAAANRAEASKKFDPETSQRIAKGEVWKGMTKEMAFASVGTPRTISTNVSGNLVKEIWLLPGRQLHFNNGKLTDIKKHRGQ